MDPATATASTLGSIDLTALAQTTTLVGTRLLPLVIFTPVFGGSAVPGRLRFGLAVVLAAAVALPLSSGRASMSSIDLALSMMHEALVGGLLAVVVLLVFECFAAAGSLLGNVRDPLAGIKDATSGERRGDLSILLSQGAVTLAVASGGLLILIEAVGDSCVAVPLGGGQAWWSAGAIVGAVIGFSSQILLLAVQFAAPVLVVSLAIDVALSLTSRLARQLDVFGEGTAIKALASLAIVAFAMPVIFAALRPLLAAAVGLWRAAVFSPAP